MSETAKFNEPPSTQQDLWVVKGTLLSSGLTKTNASNGVHLSPMRPSIYHYETKGPGIITGCAVCIFVMLLVTLKRLHLRWSKPSLKFGTDDWLMIPALLMAVAYPACQIAMVLYGGAGQHIYDVTYHQYYMYHWIAAVAQIDFFVCVGLIKMSIAIFNMRLTGMASNRLWHYGNWTFFGLVLAYIIVAFFINILKCVPAITSFDLVAIGKSGVQPKCVGVSEMNTILRVINITLDYCLLTVPIIVVWSLQMSWTKKLRIAGLFAFGALACIGSVMTLVAKSHLKTDALWNYTDLLAWTLVEMVFGVITANLPTLAFLLPGKMTSTRDYSATANSRTNGTFTSQRQDRRREEGYEFKSYLGRDEEGIMRQDEVELSSAAASEADIEALHSTHYVPYDRKAPAMFSRSMPKMDDKQPQRYGPLEHEGRTS